MVERAILITVLMMTICATANIVQLEPKTKETKMEAEAAFDQALTPLQSRSDCHEEGWDCTNIGCCKPLECTVDEWVEKPFCRKPESKPTKE